MRRLSCLMRNCFLPPIPAKAGTQRAPQGAPTNDILSPDWHQDPGFRRDERSPGFNSILIALLFVFLLPLAARAEERITSFDVTIEAEFDGDIGVTERIAVISEGDRIQRGVFRDLPRSFLKGARTLPYEYAVKGVLRDGKKEPYAVEKDGNAFRIRIGDADVFLENGPHAYEIAYEVKNQVRYFGDHDEVYWNATGNYWAFAIERASARILLPGGAGAIETSAYTGHEGDTDRHYDYRFDKGAHIFTTTAPLAAGMGMTVAVGFAKGVVLPPSAADARAEWWAANASLVILGAASLAIGAFYFLMWRRVGRDPAKGPVFARYEPPEGYSPAAVHQVYYRALKGHDALISTILHLAMKKRLRIDTTTKKNLTILTRSSDGAGAALSDEEAGLEARLFANDAEFSFGKAFNATLTSAYDAFRKALAKTYGASYFKLNYGYLASGIVVSVLSFIAATNFTLQWTSLHTAGIVGLVVMTLAAAYLLPAPTQKGQNIRTEIGGFRLYLKTAEQVQLNAVNVGSNAPPPMTVERYERFLPYAIALGVEKPWTEHFEKLMPKEAADYHPYWASGGYGGSRSLSGLNSALVSSMASGVSSSLPQSSSSSGSGGGGSSGGGGGGGGGGGW